MSRRSLFVLPDQFLKFLLNYHGVFINMLITKGDLGTISMLSWIVAMDGEEVLNAVFYSAFNSKTGCPQGTQTPELNDREQNE